ncbi:Acyl-CoA dehydrogenase [Burkholderiales bacterium 8X]|nr:Acyl-CoA dehydrogenase [Burkholderiales bacterium 8X]
MLAIEPAAPASLPITAESNRSDPVGSTVPRIVEPQAEPAGLSLIDEFSALVAKGADELPLPGGGRTLDRWRSLAGVAARSLALVKWFEGHTDAIAIQTELGGPLPPSNSRWGTWCAEPPGARVELTRDLRSGDGAVRLNGTKAWCSGALAVTHAVVSCWNEAGEPCLATVAMQDPAVRVVDSGWNAVGMAATESLDVRFDDAPARILGGPGDYVRRPGFWQGGAGIAACWYGGAEGIAEAARRVARGRNDPHLMAHLGAIDVALAGAAAALREAAEWIDRHPHADARIPALRARSVVEAAAIEVMHHAGRAVGAGPLCRDARLAQAMADLPVFLRQSHAERDLASLGAALSEQMEAPWKL